MQTHDAQQDRDCLGHCVSIDAQGLVRLRLAQAGNQVLAWVHRDVDLAALREHVREGGPALLRPVGANTWLITALVHAPNQVRAEAIAPTVLRADAIELGNGAARIWAEGRTLHLRAYHMHLRAQGHQRLTAATLALG